MPRIVDQTSESRFRLVPKLLHQANVHATRWNRAIDENAAMGAVMRSGRAIQELQPLA